MVDPEQSVNVSVVVASCRSADLVRQAIEHLLPQCRNAGAELIIARSRPAGETDSAGMYADCQLVECAPATTIPEIRGAGLTAATGDVVLLTEDNCIARADWVQRIVSGFEPGIDVVGGTMGNAHPKRGVDAGAYFAEYGFFGPSRRAPGDGASPFLTGANVAYRRSVVEDAGTWASAGDWEGAVHHRLAARGVRFALVSDAIVDQNLHYRFRSFCRDRFEHGYNSAKTRSGDWRFGRRLAMACAAPLIPPLMTWRAWQNAGRPNIGGFLRSLPHTFAFFTAWAAGESAGYLRGDAP